jgi:hypothetical protein
MRSFGRNTVTFDTLCSKNLLFDQDNERVGLDVYWDPARLVLLGFDMSISRYKYWSRQRSLPFACTIAITWHTVSASAASTQTAGAIQLHIFALNPRVGGLLRLLWHRTIAASSIWQGHPMPPRTAPAAPTSIAVSMSRQATLVLSTR